jgi:hypothetical protein
MKICRLEPEREELITNREPATFSKRWMGFSGTVHTQMYCVRTELITRYVSITVSFPPDQHKERFFVRDGDGYSNDIGILGSDRCIS